MNETARAKSSPGLWIFLAVVVLAVGGGWFWNAQKSDAEQSVKTNASVKTTLHLETFVLNLADHDQRSYLRVGVDVGLNQDLQRGVEPPTSRLRDTILSVLATAKADELLTAEGKNKLKAELLQALKERLPQMGVEEIYFTEFLIQR